MSVSVSFLFFYFLWWCISTFHGELYTHRCIRLWPSSLKRCESVLSILRTRFFKALSIFNSEKPNGWQHLTSWSKGTSSELMDVLLLIKNLAPAFNHFRIITIGQIQNVQSSEQFLILEEQRESNGGNACFWNNVKYHFGKYKSE